MTDPATSSGNDRVLVVAYYFPPMGLSGVQRVSKLVKYLPSFGFDVDVLTVRPGGYFAFDESLLRELDRPGVTIFRTASADPTRLFARRGTVPLPAEGRRKMLAGLSQLVFQPDNKIGWLPFALSRGRSLVRERGYAAVLGSAPPYTSLMIARRLAARAGVPFIADFRDDWIGNPRHRYPTRLHRRLSRRMESRVLRDADEIVTINDTIADSLAERAPGTRTVHVVPQGYDPEDFDPGAPARTERFTLLYTGVFYDAQTPDTFLRGLRMFLDRRPEAEPRTEARFVGLFPDSGRELVRSLGLTGSVVEAGYLQHAETVRELQACDVAWLTIGDRPGAAGISTGKLAEYIGSRKPILALVPKGEARRQLDGYGAVRVCDPDDTRAAASAIESLFDSWKAGTLPEPDSAHVRRFDRRSQARKVADIIRNAVSESNP